MGIKTTIRGGMDGYHAHHDEITKMSMNNREPLDQDTLPIYRDDKNDGLYVEESTSNDPYKELGSAKDLENGY